MNNQQWKRLLRRLAIFMGGFVALVFFAAQCSAPTPTVPPPPPPRTVYVTVPTAPTPTPTPTPVVTPTVESTPARIPDVDVHGDHVNLPDGALTGGYCARKWWC